ncbi:MAG: PAS domain-containing protein [Deltaproteobacteria bacterium]|nr:PAS domain-containing protein [Deltaproteobacteria bacterium]
MSFADKEVKEHPDGFGRYVIMASGLLILFGFYLTSRYNYLLFHSLAEIFSIFIACGIFMIAWNSRRFLDNNYLLFLGIAYLFIGGLDLVHMLSYKGMNIFEGYGANLPTQLWIAARYVEGISLLAAPFCLKRRPSPNLTFMGYILVTGLLLVAIFYWGLFPVCYQEGVGLTAFKKVSEYIISLILVFAAFLLYQNRAAFDRRVLKLLIASIIVTIGAELSFTFYVSVYGLSNLVGHMFKIISFYLIYKAIIQTGFQKPFNLLFRNLKVSEEALQKAQQGLEQSVAERTAELVEANVQLKQEITEHRQAEEELREGEERFRTVADFTYDWEYWQGTDGKFIYVSPSCERIIGYQAQEFVQDPNLLLTLIHPEDRENFHAHLLDIKKIDIKKSSDVFHLDFRIIRRDGQERWISHYCQSVYGADRSWLGHRASNRDITVRKEAEKKILEYQEQLRSLAMELSLAEERERRRIAIDLHDRVCQTLAMVQIDLNKLRQSVASTELDKSFDRVIRFVDTAISDTRTLTFNISPPSLYELGLEAALDELAEQMQDEYGLPITLEDDGSPKPVSQEGRVILYRAVRELMINVVKHAQAREMKVSIWGEDGHIHIEVKDDGIGFDTSQVYSRLTKTMSLGLLSIREQLVSLNGQMEIDSKPGRGTTVALVVPIEHDQSASGVEES